MSWNAHENCQSSKGRLENFIFFLSFQLLYSSWGTFPSSSPPSLPLLSFWAVWYAHLVLKHLIPSKPSNETLWKPYSTHSSPPIPFISLCLVLLGPSLWFGSDGGQKAVVDFVGLLPDLKHIWALTCLFTSMHTHAHAQLYWVLPL